MTGEPWHRDLGPLRLRLRRSLIAVPLLYLAAAIVLGFVVPGIDAERGAVISPLGGIDSTAKDVLSAVGTGMLAFTGIVIAGVLLVVQFAASQYSPRLVLWFRRDRIAKHAIGCFLASSVFAVVALYSIDAQGMSFDADLTIGVAIALLVGSSVLFLALLQRITDRLRPRTLFAAVVKEGVLAARDTYPLEPDADDRAWERADATVVEHEGSPGVVASFRLQALVALAVQADAVVELVPAVGEYVGAHRPLLRVHGGTGLEPAALRAQVLVADERTIEQDPAFALRIVVDTAVRALSPAVNDPTTAVHALDALQTLVRELALHDIEASHARDERSVVRLAWPVPTWPDMLELAFSEIRQYGASSVQVCRRLRAVLEDLLAATPPRRHEAIAAELARLDAAVLANHPAGSPDRERAMVADRIGLGFSR